MKNLKTKPAKSVAAKKSVVKPKAKIKTTPRNYSFDTPVIIEDVCDQNYCCKGSSFGKMFFGLILVLFGLFYLGRNLGFIPEINFDFQAFWPMLIIFVGLLLINRRSRISIVIGVLSALVFMLIVTFIVNFGQVQTEYGMEAVMPALRHVEKSAKTASSTVAQSEDVKLNNFKSNEVVSSPLSIEGSARGAWFFEGSFPVRVLDESGKELGVGVAQAQGNSLTDDFVPFKATIMFARPTSSIGSLVLERDNPSGLVENDKKILLPIKF
ncbi:MAG: Gmad2 immunoglobulin-like domain-containing protein [Candidatus Falkowbacteria bacterium]